VELLKEFMRVGMILDVTHLSDQSFWQAMEVYTGPMLASHHNLRALVPGDRQLTDDQVKELIARGAVIGAAFDAWMMYPGWVRGVTRPDLSVCRERQARRLRNRSRWRIWDRADAARPGYDRRYPQTGSDPEATWV
jgi:microsomal dipeptidase-like Zn-dependent dipeptidase